MLQSRSCIILWHSANMKNRVVWMKSRHLVQCNLNTSCISTHRRRFYFAHSLQNWITVSHSEICLGCLMYQNIIHALQHRVWIFLYRYVYYWDCILYFTNEADAGQKMLPLCIHITAVMWSRLVFVLRLKNIVSSKVLVLVTNAIL